MSFWEDMDLDPWATDTPVNVVSHEFAVAIARHRATVRGCRQRVRRARSWSGPTWTVEDRCM